MRLQTTFALLRPSHRSPLGRYLATAAPPPPPSAPPPSPPPSSSSSSSSSSPSSSDSSSFTGSLPPSVQAAFRTNPILKKLIGDEITRRNMKAIGEAMYKSGIEGNGTGKPTTMEMTKLMMNSELRVAIQGLTASMTRLGITMADLQPIMMELMAKGGLDGFAPTPPSSLSAPPPPSAPKLAPKPDPVMDAFKAKAELYREVVAEEIEEEKLEAKQHEKEAKVVDVEAKTSGGGFFGKLFGGGGGKKSS